MKTTFTFLFVSVSLFGFSQRTPGDTEVDFQRAPVASDISKVISQVSTSVQSRNSAKKELTTAEYQMLISKADEKFQFQLYNEAERLYSEVLTYRTDQYSSDRILEIAALKAGLAKKEEQAKKDAELRAKAENSGSVYNRKIVHFSGGLIYDEFQNHGFSKAFHEDRFSEMLGIGRYNSISQAAPKASRHTFDGIAIPANVRLVIYQGHNCTGEVLLDITGPAIVNNNLWTFEFNYRNANSKEFIPEIQSLYPQEVRKWSATNMHTWNSGSMEIMMVD